MIESVMEGDEGINRKNRTGFIFKGGIQRYREYIEILTNLERKRYWGRKVLKNIIWFCWKKIQESSRNQKKEKKKLNWESSTGSVFLL